MLVKSMLLMKQDFPMFEFYSQKDFDLFAIWRDNSNVVPGKGMDCVAIETL